MPRKKRVAPPAPPKEAYILQLPNETLQIIFSDLDIKCEYRTRGGWRSLLLGLTHVCRQFRRVIHEAGFWLKKDFDFADLLARTGGAQPRCSSRWLRTLLSDQYLQSCLERKTDWVFEDMRILSIVIDTVPSFVDVAQNLSFRIHRCHSLLSDFSAGSVIFEHVIELELGIGKWFRWQNPVKRPYNLDLMGPCFPALKTLSLSASWGVLKGTLETFPHLEHFSVEALSLGDTFKPLESPSNLTRLSIKCNVPLSLIDFDYLKRLQHFKVDGIGFPEFRPLLNAISILNITSFEASVTAWLENLPTTDPEPFEDWMANLGLGDPAPSIPSPLPNLEDLTLRFDTVEPDSQFGRVFPAFEIKSLRWILIWLCHVSSLKTFLLQAPAEVVGAAHVFNLHSLERFHWILRDDDEYKMVIRCDPEDVQGELVEFRANPSTWLTEWFEEDTKRETNPTVIVERYRDLHPSTEDPWRWRDMEALWMTATQ
jgi:F-box-like